MLSNIKLENFKCIERADVGLAPVTILAGLNGAGKSSLIQSLLLLRQSDFSRKHNRSALITAGDLVDLGSARDVLYEGATDDTFSISVRDSEMPMETDCTLQFLVQNDVARLHPHSSMPGQFAWLMFENHPTTRLVIRRDIAKEERRQFHYLNAERIGPRKFGLMSRGADDFELGSKGEHALHALHLHGSAVALADDDPRRKGGVSGRLADQLEAWLAEISPGVRLDLSAVAQADLMVGTFSFAAESQLRSREFRATNVGFGLSYVLPILMAFLMSPAGSVVLLENPEAHIHPAGQTKLGELCAYAGAAGVQVVAETHSDHFMDGVRIAVRRRALEHNKCAFHYFTRVGTKTEIASPDIDQNGKLSYWPDGFFDQHRRNAAQLIKPI